jgi:hypothetical protein
VCWRVHRGGRGLLALVTVGNLANLSFLSPAIPGPKRYMAGCPPLLVTVVLVQIVVTLVLTGFSPARHNTGRDWRQRPADAGAAERRVMRQEQTLCSLAGCL